MERANLNYQDYFKIDEDAVSLTEVGQQFAGGTGNVAYARGSMLASMAVRALRQAPETLAATLLGTQQDFPYAPVMEQAADAAQPPLSQEDREQFMAGARQVLGGNA